MKKKEVFVGKKKTVFVGMSGGVDSSVSAALLKKQGYEVVGVFIRTWHPDFIACNEEEERLDAMRASAHLGIPFLTFDFSDIYKREVADYMIAEYKAGRTPNPDVMCNKHVKFGAFFAKALSMGADYVATGHYANCVFQEKYANNFPVLLHPAGGSFRQKNYLHTFPDKGKSPLDFERGRFHPEDGVKRKNLKGSFLCKGTDSAKDQAYFLWTLKQEQLSKILFPVGHLNKKEVRKLAKKFKLPVAEKKDSQGICFLGAINLKDFLKHYIKQHAGKVLDENGKEIGFHDGVVFLTIGERHGFTITRKGPTDGPYYVVAKDIKKNILIVSQEKPEKLLFECSLGAHGKSKFSGSLINIKNTNWILEVPKKEKEYTAQIRYHGEFFSCSIEVVNENEAKVFFKEKILVDKGQSCVLYDGDIVLGGGVVF